MIKIKLDFDGILEQIFQSRYVIKVSKSRLIKNRFKIIETKKSTCFSHFICLYYNKNGNIKENTTKNTLNRPIKAFKIFLKIRLLIWNRKTRDQ